MLALPSLSSLVDGQGSRLRESFSFPFFPWRAAVALARTGRFPLCGFMRAALRPVPNGDSGTFLFEVPLDPREGFY